MKQLNTPYFPRADGVFIQEAAQQQLLNGQVAAIPFVAGISINLDTTGSIPAHHCL